MIALTTLLLFQLAGNELQLRQDGTHVLLDVPQALVGRELLWTVQLEGPETSNGYTIRSVQALIVRFERDGDTLRLMGNQMAGRKEDATFKEIRAFPIASSGQLEIDVTPAVMGDVPSLSPAWTLGSAGLDAKNSHIRAMPSKPGRVGLSLAATFLKQGEASVTGTVIHYLSVLPKTPAHSRRADPHVNLISNLVNGVPCATRFSLRKGHPIVYFISPEVPSFWRPFIRNAIEAWNGPLGKAGFPHALECRDAPQNDPSWCAADPFTSVVRWSEGSTENATGYTVLDPRSGEILSAKVVIGAKCVSLFSRLYFAQCAATDARALSLPLPQNLQGEFLQYTVEHEVGHTLGLDHNSLASSAYTAAQLRDAEFTRKHGDVASVMSYGRFNYVAQPGDQASAIPKIGPSDYFSIEYLYREPSDPRDEDEFLRAMLARQGLSQDIRADERDFRIAHPIDPDVQWEKLGKDTLEASKLGLMNLELAADVLSLQAKSLDPAMVSALDEALWRQRSTELGHVITLIAGIRDPKGLYRTPRPVPAAEQREALEFVLKNGIEAPAALLRTSTLSRREAGAGAREIQEAAKNLFETIFDETRLARMSAGSSLSIHEVLTAVDHAVWSELDVQPLNISFARQILQSAYIDVLCEKLGPDGRAETKTILRPIAQELILRLHRSNSSHLWACEERLRRIADL